MRECYKDRIDNHVILEIHMYLCEDILILYKECLPNVFVECRYCRALCASKIRIFWILAVRVIEEEESLAGFCFMQNRAKPFSDSTLVKC